MEWNPKAAEEALQIIASRNLQYVEAFYGNAMQAVAGCLRGLFLLGEAGVSSDYSAIEGVVTAAIAGCQWRLDVFRTHGKIYEMGAAKITGIPFETIMAHAGYTDLTKPQWWLEKQTGKHHPVRQNPGKISELALGFGGWIGAWYAFDGPGTEPEVKRAILAWRDASPEIPELWGGQHRKSWSHGGWRPELFGLEGMAISAVLQPGTTFTTHGVSYLVRDDVLYCTVPGGGLITYHRPRLTERDTWRGREFALSYEGWNTNPKMGPIGWVTIDTWGGKLTENVVQKTARDIFEHGKLRLARAGYAITMHTYDEACAENATDVKEFERLMAFPLPWCADWPVKAAGGWTGRRYRKD